MFKTDLGNNFVASLSPKEIAELRNNFEPQSAVGRAVFAKLEEAYQLTRQRMGDYPVPETDNYHSPNADFTMCIHEGVCPTCGFGTKYSELGEATKHGHREVQVKCVNGHTHGSIPTEYGDWDSY